MNPVIPPPIAPRSIDPMPPGRYRTGQDTRQKPKNVSVRLTRSVITKATKIGQGDLQVGLRRAVHVLGLDTYPPPVIFDAEALRRQDDIDPEPMVKSPFNVTLTQVLYKQAMSLGYRNVARGLRIAVRLFPQAVIDAEVGTVYTPEPPPPPRKVTTASLTNAELNTAMRLGEIPGARTPTGKPMASASRGVRYVIDRLIETPLDPRKQIDVEKQPDYRLTAKESIRLSQEQYDYVERIGGGNVARGIRYALRVGEQFK
jgi:hypothetical protein